MIFNLFVFSTDGDRQGCSFFHRLKKRVVALTFSILNFSIACVAESTASCCISSLMSAFLMTALRSDMMNVVCVVGSDAATENAGAEYIYNRLVWKYLTELLNRIYLRVPQQMTIGKTRGSYIWQNSWKQVVCVCVCECRFHCYFVAMQSQHFRCNFNLHISQTTASIRDSITPNTTRYVIVSCPNVRMYL